MGRVERCCWSDACDPLSRAGVRVTFSAEEDRDYKVQAAPYSMSVLRGGMTATIMCMGVSAFGTLFLTQRCASLLRRR